MSLAKDWLEVHPPIGAMYVSSPAATTVTVNGTYYKVAGTTTAGPLNTFSMPANNRLKYDGDETRKFRITASVSMTTDGTNINVRFAIAKNGTIETGSIQARRVGTGSDIGNAGISWVVELAKDDYIEVFTTADTGTPDVTADLLSVSVSV